MEETKADDVITKRMIHLLRERIVLLNAKLDTLEAMLVELEERNPEQAARAREELKDGGTQ